MKCRLSWLLFAACALYLCSTSVLSTSCSSDSDCGGSDIKHEICSSEGLCSTCSSDSQCSDGVCSNGYCTLDSLFDTFSMFDIFATLAILIGAIVAAGGGLGGGGIFVPVFILIISLQTKSAAALSQATIFGGSIVNLIMNFREHHPLRKHRPLPDLPTIIIFEPMLLGGTIVGVILNIIFPDPIILACLIVTLTYATIRTTRKGFKMWRKESELQKENEENIQLNSYKNLGDNNLKKMISGAISSVGNDINFEKDINQLTTDLFPRQTHMSSDFKDDSSNENDENDSSISDDISDNDAETVGLIDTNMSYGSLNKPHYTRITEKWINMAEACGLQPSEMTKQFLTELEPYIKDESRVLYPMLFVGLIWIIVSLFSIFRGVKSIFNVESCSAAYWSLTFGVFPFLFLITFIMAYREVRKFAAKRQLGWEPADGDIEWTTSRAITYPTIAGFAGLMGGLLGIGGGMIVSPLLLELGVLPRVAAATSALAVMVTSSSATLQFVLLGMLKLDYMLFFMGVGIVGTFIGQTAVNHCVKKWGRPSVVVFAVAAVIGLAVLLMGLDGILNIVNGDTSLTFTSVC